MTENETAGDRPAIDERGELSLELGGADMVLRPSYEAIVAFEASTGKGLLDLTREAISGRLPVSDAAQIACECVKAWGRETGNKGAGRSNAPRVASLILDAEGGFNRALRQIAAMLSLASTGGYTSSGNLRPTATTMMTEQAPVVG